MPAPSEAVQIRRRIRLAIQREFAGLVKNVKSGPGALSGVAAQIGVSRTMLDLYAGGSVPRADVLLVAFLKWGWSIRIEDLTGEPSWCEFSVSDMEGGVRRRKREPVQLSLFDALTELDQNIDVLKKSVGRVETEIQRAFDKSA
jgi:hypothetical protein